MASIDLRVILWVTFLARMSLRVVCPRPERGQLRETGLDRPAYPVLMDPLKPFFVRFYDGTTGEVIHEQEIPDVAPVQSGGTFTVAWKTDGIFTIDEPSEDER